MPSFDYAHVTAALEGCLSPDALTAEEQEVWFDQFADAMIARGSKWSAARRSALPHTALGRLAQRAARGDQVETCPLVVCAVACARFRWVVSCLVVRFGSRDAPVAPPLRNPPARPV